MVTQAQEKISEVIPKLIKVDIVCNKRVLFPVELNPNETLMELRQILSETSQLFFYISYSFYFEGKKLDEFSEVLTQANLTNGSQLEIQFQQYDERSCKYHIKKVQEFVNNPQNYGHILSSPLKWSVDNLPDMKEKLEKIEESQTKKEFDVKNLLSINDALETKLNLYSNISSSRKDKSEKIGLLFSLGQSAFNPPSQYRKLRGDLVYLHLKTLEGHEHHISGCFKGFYFNKSSNRVYDPTPANSLISYSILDLISSVSPLFNQKIKEIIDSENILPNLAQNLANPLSLYSYGRSWLIADDEKVSQNHEPNWLRAEMAFTNLYGFEPSSVREWNDEFQASLELPKDDLFQRLNRDKALIKSHSDFVEAAIQGAKAIIEKNLLPLNPMDPQNQQVFVYNHIFFSFVTPCPDSFKQETGPDACPTVPMSNCDLRNLKVLLRLKLADLSLVHTCIIDYKGWTVVAQSIIPGILSVDHSLCTEFGTLDDGKTINSSPDFEAIIKKVCDYFSLEEDIPFLDESGKEHKISGSVEVKGIKGTDRRRYLLDLLRLSPRDVNWVSEGDEYLCCVLRPEIISHYVTSKNLIAAREKVLEEREKEQKESAGQTEEKEEIKTEIQTDKTNENVEKKATNSFTYADFITKLQQQLQRPDKEKVRLNSNLYTRIKLGDIANLEEQKKKLQEVADFITKQAIPNLIKELLHGEVSLPVDSQTLGELLHGHGINVRYIGKIAQSVSKGESPFLLILLERIIFAKCLKHFIKEQMRGTNQEDFPELVARILNSTFGSEKCLEVLENGQQQPKVENENNTQAQEETKEAAAEGASKKKKKKNKEEKSIETREEVKGEDRETQETSKSAKKKNKKKKAGIAKPVENSSTVSDIFIQIDNLNLSQEQDKQYNKVKPSDIWKRIIEIANKRYHYELPASFKEFVPFKYPLTKLATLRDFCLSTGIKLATKHYQLNHNGKHHFSSEQKSTGGQRNASFLAFTPEDIMDISPIIKHLDPISQDAGVNLEIAHKLIAEREFEDAIDSLVASIQIFMNLYGPIHKDIAVCYSRLGSLFFKMEDYQQALIHHKQALIVLEKFYGTDHPQTGHAYLNLGLFYFSVKEYERGFSYMLKSLYCFNLVGGECHPEASNVLVSLASKYQEQKKHQAAISCLLEALDRSTIIFGEKSPRVAHIYQQLAVAHFEIKDIKKATEFQENAIKILKENYPHTDPKVTDAVLNLQKIQNSGKEKLAEEVKKQSNEPKKRAFGQNRPLNASNGQRENANEKFNADQADLRNEAQFERESALQKLKFARLQAKQGMRAQNQVDLLRYMQYLQARSGYANDGTGQAPSTKE